MVCKGSRWITQVRAGEGNLPKNFTFYSAWCIFFSEKVLKMPSLNLSLHLDASSIKCALKLISDILTHLDLAELKYEGG